MTLCGAKKGRDMNTHIYYFSGTGNSIYIAKRISELLDVKVISIVSTFENTTSIAEADCIGIVFSYYLSQLNGLPLLVEDFCKLVQKFNLNRLY